MTVERLSNIAVESDTQVSEHNATNRIEPFPRPGYHGKYPKWIGHKFEIDGSVRNFPGHSIMCMIPQESDMHHALCQLYATLQQQSFSKSLTLLPPSSWHMTIYEGVSDQIRRRNCWPPSLALDCPLSECNDYVSKRLKEFNLNCEPIFRMAVTGWWSIDDGFVLNLVGATPAEEQKLRDLREQLARQIGLRHPGFGEFQFHVGLAYQLRFIDQRTRDAMTTHLQTALEMLPREFELEAPAFYTYQSMVAFDRQFYLRKEKQQNCLES
jgi:hypothetical protein